MITWPMRVARLEEAVVAWRGLLLNPQDPERGSSLARDDEVFPPMPCSLLAWWGISLAVEHLDAGLRLLNEQAARGGPYFSDANYTLLRGALLGAPQMPASREQRTTDALRLAHEEFRRASNLREHVSTRDLRLRTEGVVSLPSIRSAH